MKPLLESRCLYPQGNGTALKSSSPARLPTLANHCVIVGEGRRADVIWSEGDFLALCEHMLNQNPPDHFLTAWIDREAGQARFAKAPMRSRADKRASWAWATIIGKAKAKTAIGFYPSNPEKKSRWAAIDFDAHNGEREQARNAHWTPSHYYCNNRGSTLSFAHPVTAITCSFTVANCIRLASGSCF
jgi:hypothetical protein